MTDPQSMLEEEFAGPFRLWQERPGPETAGSLLTALNPVVDSAMRTYGGAKPSPTLRSKARLLTLDALKKYDPSRAKLRTHLMVHLQALRRASAREGQIITLPERVAIELGRVNEAENVFRDRYGRDPSDLELAGAAGLSLKRLTHVRQARPGLSEGAATAVQSEDGPGLAAPAIVDPNDDTWLAFVYHDLQPVDQLVMAHSLGMFGRPKLSKQQIAAKLGVSPGAVSQRAAKIQARLDMKDQLDVNFF